MKKLLILIPIILIALTGCGSNNNIILPTSNEKEITKNILHSINNLCRENEESFYGDIKCGSNYTWTIHSNNSITIEKYNYNNKDCYCQKTTTTNIGKNGVKTEVDRFIEFNIKENIKDELRSTFTFSSSLYIKF